MKTKKTEKLVFFFMLGAMIFGLFFFSIPQPVMASIMICGVWYPPLPITAHDFIYESNCCIVIIP